MTTVFDRSNIEPQPNPKPLRVERVTNPIRGEHGGIIGEQTLIIRNSNLDPAALTGRW